MYILLFQVAKETVSFIVKLKEINLVEIVFKRKCSNMDVHVEYSNQISLGNLKHNICFIFCMVCL